VWYSSAIAAIYTRTIFTFKDWRLLLPSKSSKSELELAVSKASGLVAPAARPAPAPALGPGPGLDCEGRPTRRFGLLRGPFEGI
jgi:hypothetical protein